MEKAFFFVLSILGYGWFFFRVLRYTEGRTLCRGTRWIFCYALTGVIIRLCVHFIMYQVIGYAQHPVGEMLIGLIFASLAAAGVSAAGCVPQIRRMGKGLWKMIRPAARQKRQIPAGTLRPEASQITRVA